MKLLTILGLFMLVTVYSWGTPIIDQNCMHAKEIKACEEQADTMPSVTKSPEVKKFRNKHNKKFFSDWKRANQNKKERMMDKMLQKKAKAFYQTKEYPTRKLIFKTPHGPVMAEFKVQSKIKKAPKMQQRAKMQKAPKMQQRAKMQKAPKMQQERARMQQERARMQRERARMQRERARMQQERARMQQERARMKKVQNAKLKPWMKSS